MIYFVDVDDTLVRTHGSKVVPIVKTIQSVRDLAKDGHTLYCWSAGGDDYARRIATQLGIASCFAAFLPKPHVLIDDQHPSEWRTLKVLHPSEL
jgi:predicted HAD superfamily phosphohydrolase YqeG